MFRRHLLAATLLGLLAVAPALAPSAQAAPVGPQAGDWALTYKVYVGGVHVLDANAHVALLPDAYRIGVQAATDGFLGRVANWRTDIATAGAVTPDGRIQPILYRTVGSFRDEPQNTTVDYRADGNPVVTLAEPPPEEDREPVPPDLMPGTVDPMSAVMAALQAVAQGRGCTADVAVYDGRQRYDLAFLPKGTETLEATEYSPFAGPAEACGFKFTPRAGRWKERDRRDGREEDAGRRNRDGRDITVWVAPAAAEAPPVPVRAEAPSPLGTVKIHLAEIRRVDAAPAATGKTQAALAPTP
ncbi:MAG: hypothetical protein RLY86_281 [Pseudomonadota bacterium]|jgi:hypothetical protein